jgi:cysteine synthase A
MPHFVLVESNTTGTGQIVVERLLARGDRITFLTRSRSKYGFLANSEPRLSVLEVDTNDRSAVLSAMRTLQALDGVDAVLTLSEFYVETVGEAAITLGLPGLDPEAARTCRHKPSTRHALRQAGLFTPEFHLVTSQHEALKLSKTISYPCVIKPPTGSSSHGVRLIYNAVEFIEHYNVIHSWKENERGQRLSGDVLVETLLEGSEYSVETFTLPGGAHHVVGVTDKHLSKPPWFVEVGHDFPSRAPAAICESLVRTVLQALAAVKFNFGPAHTEILWTSNGPAVVEINPRLAGGMIPELVRYATGIDSLQCWADLLLGNTVDLSPKHAASASIRFLTAPSPGCIRAVRGVQEALLIPSVREVFVARKCGDRVNLAADAYDRLGFVIGSGRDSSLVARHVQRAVETIEIEVEPVALAGCSPAAQGQVPA